MNIVLPDDLLAQTWQNIDWNAAEEKLIAYQAELTKAAYRQDEKAIRNIQTRIVRDLDIKCLAVRHVASSGSGPGVDGIRWKTDAQCMRAAASLTSKDYHAQPLRQIVLKARNTGKERKPGLPTYHDKAMSVLYGYSFIPVAEAHAERKSFAFRPGRSALDAQAYVLEALKGKDAPEFIFCGDVKGCFANIQHTWLLNNIPMDRKVLRELLSVGIVFAGELFPTDGVGISEGSNLSPYLANYTLDGMQKYIYRGLFNTEHPTDYKNGNLIRFADDFIVTARTRETAEKIHHLLRQFLEERGLAFSPQKTSIRTIDEGFNFLGQTFIRKGEYVYSYPSEKAVTRFTADLQETIMSYKKSQRDLITLLNQKLRGWGNYHRYSDAGPAFRQIDTVVQTALLDAAIQRHPRMQKAKVIAKYWYKEADGRHCYALPEDKSIRVIRLADTVLLQHKPVKTNMNPYLERDYMESRTHKRDITNVCGPYRSVWERQGGICRYCGRPILSDQPRTVVPLDLSKSPSPRNSAYIHKICEQNTFELITTMEDIGAMRPFDVMTTLEGIDEAPPKGTRVKGAIKPSWKHMKFKEYLAQSSAATVTLTFKDVEKIDGRPLPRSARMDKNWWYPRQNCNMIAEAWLTEGYTLKHIDMEKEKLQLERKEAGLSHLIVPEVLTSKKIPDDAIFELERHMNYVIEKYGLAL